MADELDNFAKFLAGTPLTDELAALREGKTLETEPAPALPAEDAEQARWELQKPFTASDVAELRDFVTHRGWTLFIRIQNRMVHKLQETAISMSKQDPLLHGAEISRAWAYLGMYEAALRDMKVNLEREIKGTNEP